MEYKNNINENFINKIKEEIINNSIIEKGDFVLVALSGGPDSMAMSEFLRTIKNEFNLKLACFHLNHMLRGKESDADEKFVIDYCKRNNIKLIVEHINTKEYCKKNRLSIEDGARKIRYELLEKCANEISANKIALAHHADDQIETFFMRLIRGTGIDGLSVMKQTRGNIVRPFLNIYKDEILGFLKKEKIKYRADHTNLLPHFYRNKIRLKVLPEIDKINASWRKNVTRSIRLIQSDTKYLSGIANKEFLKLAKTSKKNVVIELNRLAGIEKQIQNRIFRLAIELLKGNLLGIDQKHIEVISSQLKKEKNFKLSLPGKILVCREYEKLIFAIGGNKKMAPIKEGIPLLAAGETKIENIKLKIISSTKKVKKGETLHKLISCKKEIITIDADKIKLPLIIRSYLPGDRFKPLGAKGSKKVHGYFIDKKISPTEREKALVVLSVDEIIWLVGYEISESVKISDKTKNVLTLKLETI